MIDPTAGAGAMADRVRAFRWDDTPLGPLGAWPASLRSAVALVLESRVPMALWWGESLTAIYNDACVPLLAGRHPAAFGRAAAEGWHDVWHVLGPQARRVLDGGAHPSGTPVVGDGSCGCRRGNACHVRLQSGA